MYFCTFCYSTPIKLNQIQSCIGFTYYCPKNLTVLHAGPDDRLLVMSSSESSPPPPTDLLKNETSLKKKKKTKSKGKEEEDEKDKKENDNNDGEQVTKKDKSKSSKSSKSKKSKIDINTAGAQAGAGGTEAKNEGQDPRWAYEPPSGMVQLDMSRVDEEFEWEAVKEDDDKELWLFRIPDGVSSLLPPSPLFFSH